MAGRGKDRHPPHESQPIPTSFRPLVTYKIHGGDSARAIEAVGKKDQAKPEGETRNRLIVKLKLEVVLQREEKTRRKERKQSMVRGSP